MCDSSGAKRKAATVIVSDNIRNRGSRNRHHVASHRMREETLNIYSRNSKSITRLYVLVTRKTYIVLIFAKQ